MLKQIKVLGIALVLRLGLNMVGCDDVEDTNTDNISDYTLKDQQEQNIEENNNDNENLEVEEETTDMVDCYDCGKTKKESEMEFDGRSYHCGCVERKEEQKHDAFIYICDQIDSILDEIGMGNNGMAEIDENNDIRVYVHIEQFEDYEQAWMRRGNGDYDVYKQEMINIAMKYTQMLHDQGYEQNFVIYLSDGLYENVRTDWLLINNDLVIYDMYDYAN